MAVRKIDLMYQLFGKTEGLCKDCDHYLRERYRDKLYRKCEIYGVTNSEASDWVGRYQACGMFNKLYPHKDSPIIRQVKHEKELEKPMEGQVRLFGD